MGVIVNQIKKISAFCSTELENIYYYRFLFLREQKRIIKEHPCQKNKKYEIMAKKYYASYGIKINPIWHLFYTENNGIEDVKYVPENLYFGKIEPYYNHKEYAKAIDDKNYYDLHLNIADIKIPYIYVRNVDGIFYDHDFNIICEDECIHILKKVESFVIKPSIEGKGGSDVSFIDEPQSVDNLKELLLRYYANYVIQEVIHQKGVLHEIHPTSVNTVRFMTFIIDGKVEFLSSVLRVGGGVSRIDNAHSGGIFCGIDENGCTKKMAWNQRFEQLQKHPNGKDYANIKVPNYQNAIELVKRQHLRLGHFRIISWDVAISEDDIYIIEFNITPQGIDLHQICNGPLFGKYTDQVLAEIKYH